MKQMIVLETEQCCFTLEIINYYCSIAIYGASVFSLYYLSRRLAIKMKRVKLIQTKDTVGLLTTDWAQHLSFDRWHQNLTIFLVW